MGKAFCSGTGELRIIDKLLVKECMQSGSSERYFKIASDSNWPYEIAPVPIAEKHKRDDGTIKGLRD